MQAPDPLDRLRNAAVVAVATFIDMEASGLMSVLRRSVDYAIVDPSKKEIVVDRRAILLAMIAVGVDPSYQYANCANWFADWLKRRLPTLDLAKISADVRTSEKRLAEEAEKGRSLVPSGSLLDAFEDARRLTRSTRNRDKVALRHLFVALIDQRGERLEIKELSWKPSTAEIGDLRATLFNQIGRRPEPGESLDSWRKFLRQPASESKSGATPAGGSGENGGSAPPTPVPPASPAYFVSAFSADRTTDHDSDPLETEADVLAMARLICHEDADPPISIGVFGGWGSGKSTFMEALQWEVAQLADPAAKGSQPQEGPRFVSPVVQIRFNAWQFADADLWASLTAEFFDQLRAGGFEGGGKRIHGQLVEKVGEHVRGLGKEAADRRSARSRAEKELRAAQAAHADAVRQKDAGVREALVSGLAEAFERRRADLVRVGLVDSGSSDQLAQFIAVTKDVRTVSGRAKRVVMILLRHWPLLLGGALIVSLLSMAAVALTDRDLAGAITAAVGAAAMVLPFIRSALRAMQAVVLETAPFADSIDEAEKKGLKGVLDSEVKVRRAREEAEALRAASVRADTALARYVDPEATANPPRLLRYLLEDDPDTKAFEKEIGLLGRARRLFQALDQIVRDNRLKQEKARGTGKPSAEAGADAPDPDIPARIILYIDDLDRCTHEQVYKVLQAIHLLLAFELFVVVVAVDVAWIEAALAKSIEFAGSDFEEDDAKETARRQRAIEYLSKIFQLPFWLKPFSGKDDARYANYVRSLTRAAAADTKQPTEKADQGREQEGEVRPASPPAPPSPVGDGKVPPEEEGAGEGDGRNEAEDAKGASGEKDGNAPERRSDEVARGLRTLQLTKDEEDFLASPEIAALAAADPRGVKRLVNVYKVVRSRLSEQDEASIVGSDGRPPIFPIIAVCAAVETGQPIPVADAFYNKLKSRPTDGSVDAFPPAPAIDAAIAAAVGKRGGEQMSAAEMLAVARIVRRYSFNRYH